MPPLRGYLWQPGRDYALPVAKKRKVRLGGTGRGATLRGGLRSVPSSFVLERRLEPSQGFCRLSPSGPR